MTLQTIAAALLGPLAPLLALAPGRPGFFPRSRGDPRPAHAEGPGCSSDLPTAD